MNPRSLRAFRSAAPLPGGRAAVSALALLLVACGGATPVAVTPTTLPTIGVRPAVDKPQATVLDPRLNEEYLLAQGVAIPKADGYQGASPPALLGVGAKDPASEVLVVVGASRWTLRGRDVKTGPDLPEPVDGVLPIPARLGGGYLFFGAKWLWRAETPLGPAKAFVYHAGDSLAPVFGEDVLYLRASRSDLTRAFRMSDGGEVTPAMGSHATLFRVGNSVFSFTSAGATLYTEKAPPKPIVTPDGKVVQLQATPTGAVAMSGKRSFDVDVTGVVTPRNDGDPFPMIEDIPALPPEHLAAQGAVHLFPDGTVLGDGDALPMSEVGMDDREERFASMLRLFSRGTIESHQSVTISSDAPESCRLFEGEGPAARVICTPRDGRGMRLFSLHSDGSHGPPELVSTSDSFDEGPAPEGAPVYWTSSCTGDRHADKWCVPNGEKWVEVDMPAAPPATFGVPGPAVGGGKMGISGLQRFYFADTAFATGDGAMTLLRRGEKEWRVERVDAAGTRLLYALPAPKQAHNYRVLSATSEGVFTLLHSLEDAVPRPSAPAESRLVRLDENGLAELVRFKRVAAHGRRIFGVDAKDRFVESSDGGAHFRAVAAPPGGAPTIDRCTAAGCFLGPLFRQWDGGERGYAWPSVVAGEVPPAPPTAVAPVTLACKTAGGAAQESLISASEEEAPENPPMFPMTLATGALVRGGTLTTPSGTDFRVLLPFDVAGPLRSYAEAPSSTGNGRSMRFMLPALPNDLATPGALIWGRPGVVGAPTPGKVMGRSLTQQAGLYIGNKAETVQGIYDYSVGRLTTKGDVLVPFYGNGMMASEMKYSLQRVADAAPTKGVSYTDPIVGIRGGRAEVLERVASNLPPTTAAPIRAGATALPAWSTLRPLGAPGCTGDGVRMLLEVPASWLDVAWEGKTGTSTGGIAVVRATKDRLCLEAIDLALTTSDPAARLVAKAEAAPARYAIARFGPSAGGRLATFHAGKFRSEAITCSFLP